MCEADFTQLSALPAGLRWLNESEARYGLEEGRGLVIHCVGGTDYWQHTYYAPPINKANGPALVHRLEAPDRAQWQATTTFTLVPVHQFDQAGLLVYVDDHHWLKAGIEFVDGQPKLSCVVTEGRSDWSTQAWSSLEDVTMRVSRSQDAYIVECKREGGCWEQIRLAPALDRARNEAPVSVGVYCSAPTEEGMSVVIKHLNVNFTRL